MNLESTHRLLGTISVFTNSCEWGNTILQERCQERNAQARLRALHKQITKIQRDFQQKGSYCLYIRHGRTPIGLHSLSITCCRLRSLKGIRSPEGRRFSAQLFPALTRNGSASYRLRFKFDPIEPNVLFRQLSHFSCRNGCER
jgi:hypothetical protein